MLKRRLDAALQGAGGKFTRQVFWGDADDFGPAYWQALSTVSLFATPSVLVLRRAEAQGADFWEKLARPLSGFNEYVWPVFCLEGPQDPKKGYAPPKTLGARPYWKLARDKGWVWTSPGLTADTMLPMLTDWAASRRLRLGKDVARELARLLPADMTAAARELEKLELAADGEVRFEHLELVSFQAGMDTFAFVRALVEGRDASGVWRKILGNELAGDEGLVFAFLALMLRDARIMWQLLHGEDEGIRLWPRLRQEREAMARRLGVSGLARFWEAAMEAEWGIKSGQRTPDQAMEMLAAGLSALAGQRERG